MELYTHVHTHMYTPDGKYTLVTLEEKNVHKNTLT